MKIVGDGRHCLPFGYVGFVEIVVPFSLINGDVRYWMGLGESGPSRLGRLARDVDPCAKK